MKKLYTFFLALVCALMLNAQNVPNGGFENWTEGEPDEWTTSNGDGTTTVHQDDDSNTGSYAVRLQTDNEETVTPQIISGYDGFGIPVSVRYESLTFHYQYTEAGSDKLVIAILIADEDYQTLGSGGLEIEDATVGYELAIVPIEYTTEGDAAHAIIQIFLVDGFGNGPPDSETYALIDDIEFPGGVGIGENEEIVVNVYPNPASEMLRIDANLQI